MSPRLLTLLALISLCPACREDPPRRQVRVMGEPGARDAGRPPLEPPSLNEQAQAAAQRYLAGPRMLTASLTDPHAMYDLQMLRAVAACTRHVEAVEIMEAFVDRRGPVGEGLERPEPMDACKPELRSESAGVGVPVVFLHRPQGRVRAWIDQMHRAYAATRVMDMNCTDGSHKGWFISVRGEQVVELAGRTNRFPDPPPRVRLIVETPPDLPEARVLMKGEVLPTPWALAEVAVGTPLTLTVQAPGRQTVTVTERVRLPGPKRKTAPATDAGPEVVRWTLIPPPVAP